MTSSQVDDIPSMIRACVSILQSGDVALAVPWRSRVQKKVLTSTVHRARHRRRRPLRPAVWSNPCPGGGASGPQRGQRDSHVIDHPASRISGSSGSSALVGSSTSMPSWQRRSRLRSRPWLRDSDFREHEPNTENVLDGA